MSDIRTYSSNSTASAVLPKENCTRRVERFAQYLHEFKSVLEEEFNDISKKAEQKPCKAFTDKLQSLAAIYQAEDNLYYWYVKSKKPKQ